jgi:hypothetical protein
MGDDTDCLTYLHKFKCLECGLHFIACSWYEDWPLGSGAVWCPECGEAASKLHWVEATEQFIFQLVPGSARPAPMPVTGNEEA